jgi:DNA-binding transcriptional MocR family regulator
MNDNTLDRITQELRGLVESQAPGSRLPPVRELMSRHGAGPGTVQRAVSQLVAEGLVQTRPGRGNFVAQRASSTVPADLGWQSAVLGEKTVSTDGLDELLEMPRVGVIPLTIGYLPEDLQPLRQLAAAAARAARRPGVWGRVPSEGLEGLRTWIAREAGAGLRAQDVLVTSGGQAALSTAFRALAAPGSPVLVESPTYVGALAAVRAAGLRPVPVPTDGQGVRPDLLEETLSSSGARLFYCQPVFANPHGATLATERREAVLRIVRSAGAFLVEDDPARDLFLENEPPPPPLASQDPEGHVIYVRSLTKFVVPGLRVGVLCARGAAGARLKAARVVDDFFVAGILQETALEFLASPSWRRHMTTVRKTLRARRDALVEVVRRDLPVDSLSLVPKGGLHLWLKLPDEVDDVRLADELRRQGVVVSAGRHWFPAEPPGSFLRISYAGAEIDVLSEGVAVLARVMDDLIA